MESGDRLSVLFDLGSVGETVADGMPLVIPTLIAVAAFFVKRRADELGRHRQLCAEALATALQWLELPYRIRRRQDETADARALVAQQTHALQERIAFYQSWLKVELPEVASAYGTLCAAVKSAAAAASQDAWKRPGIRLDADMNVGNLQLPSVEIAEEHFLRVTRTKLSLWRGWTPWW